jgi:hypothetical protein
VNVKRTSAAAAVTALGLALGAGAAFAADTVVCGTPAVAAVYETVVVEGTPAVTHLEYRWSTQTVPVELQWRMWVVDQPAQPAVYRTVTHPAVYETVVVTPAQPARDEQVEQPLGYDEYEFVHVRSGRTHWDPDPAWNAQSVENSNGWQSTGNSRPATETATVHIPAVPEVTEEVLVTPEREEQVLVTPAVPEEGHFDYQWSQASPGTGWEETGESRNLEPVVESRWAAQSPGDGWERTDESRVVVDQAATEDSTKQVLVSPAVPAGPACPVVTPATPVVNPPAKPASAVPQVGTVSKPAAVNQAPAELAHTGADLTLLWIGLGTLLAGAGLSAGYRKALRLN